MLLKLLGMSVCIGVSDLSLVTTKQHIAALNGAVCCKAAVLQELELYEACWPAMACL